VKLTDSSHQYIALVYIGLAVSRNFTFCDNITFRPLFGSPLQAIIIEWSKVVLSKIEKKKKIYWLQVH